jgi:hypothetical protein
MANHQPAPVAHGSPLVLLVPGRRHDQPLTALGELWGRVVIDELQLPGYDALLRHLRLGESWEGFVIEHLAAGGGLIQINLSSQRQDR